MLNARCQVPSSLLEVRETDEDGVAKRQIRRKTPFKPKDPAAIEQCTLYLENLPPHADNDSVKAHFEQYGSVAYVSLPRYT